MDINKVLIVGSGFMGSGIAYVTAAAGKQVVLVDKEQSFLDKAMSNIKDMIKDGISRNKLSPHQGQQMASNFSTNLSIADAAQGVDLVIEAVYENFEVKEEIFAEVAKHVSDNTLVASNTSTISITKLAQNAKDPSKFGGLHFFSPVPAMKLVEVIQGEKTSKDTMSALAKFSEEIGKTTVQCKDSPGFIFNRLFVPMANEAAKLLDKGIATAEEIDKAAVLGGNFPAGPLTIADMAGLDILYSSLKVLNQELGDCYTPSTTLTKLIEEGKLGMKTKAGFYDYS